IANDANVQFNRSTNGTDGGAITGTGAVTKSGTGDVTFSGVNSYSGGTTVSAGTLTGTTSSLQGPITNDANVTISQSTNGTYGGAIGGASGRAKVGSGTVTLSGLNTYSGRT